MEEKAKRIAELLKVLANETRLLILCTLIEGPRTVNEIQEKISSASQSAISQHLAKLKALNVLDNKKSGQYITYYICDEKIYEVMKVLQENYC